ncbi:hypothetical protein [Vibrio makurazakiensis]
MFKTQYLALFGSALIDCNSENNTTSTGSYMDATTIGKAKSNSNY